MVEDPWIPDRRGIKECKDCHARTAAGDAIKRRRRKKRWKEEDDESKSHATVVGRRRLGKEMCLSVCVLTVVREKGKACVTE